ncbi:MAG: pilus assembly protein TadB [Actinomycetota bacterium]|nr:pilus assembly protein TadB [Actinomycetota bacterium]
MVEVTSLALLAGVGFGLGLLCVVAGLRGIEVRLEPRPARASRRPRAEWRRLGIAVSVGLAVVALTRWPVGGVLAAALVAAWHALFAQRSVSAAEITRIEAIASWTEMLRDTLVAAAGLEEAIVATAPLAPAPIRAEVTTLAARLQAREASLAQALPDLAESLADPTADLVVAALISAATRRVRNLAELLGALATSAREHAELRMRVETGRARVRTSARVVTVFTLAMAGGLVVLKRDFLAPYNDVEGQLVLALVGATFAAGFWWLTRMSRMEPPERFLTGWQPPTEVGS